MFFYFLILTAILACLYQIYRLWKLEKHDMVLYRFCEIRRAVMSKIREGNFNLSKDDYIALRHLVEATSVTIHDYNQWKTSLFNFRRFKERVRNIKTLNREIAERKISNPDIFALYQQYTFAMFLAFIAYTPFLRSELGIKTLSMSINGMAKISMGKFKKNLNRAVEFINWVRQQADKNNKFNPHHST